jgi:hypothetical protein
MENIVFSGGTQAQQKWANQIVEKRVATIDSAIARSSDEAYTKILLEEREKFLAKNSARHASAIIDGRSNMINNMEGLMVIAAAQKRYKAAA